MKKILFTLLIAAISLTLSCEKKQPHSFKTQILHLNLSADPYSLDPRIARSLKDLTLTKHLFEGLMLMNEDGRIENALAQDVSISEDGLGYTFILRKSQWSNGDPVTAFDFEYAWKKVLDPDFATDYSHMLYPIKNAKNARVGKCTLEEVGIKALDEDTLFVELESVTPYFLELVSFPTYFPINKEFEKSHPNWANKMGKTDEKTFICNGAFRLAEWNPDNRLVLRKNPLYWDSTSVILEEIEFSIIGDNATESQLFEKGKIDWLGQPMSNNISTELIGELKKQNRLLSFPVAGTFWLKFNTETPPFDHPKIRKAFAYAINRQDIIDHALQGNQKSATTPVPPCMELSNTPFFHDGDRAYANRLFDEALVELGVKRKDFPAITLSYPISERNNKIVQIVQRQWEESFCVQINLKGFETQLYRHLVKKGDFQVGPGDWIGDFNDPITFLEIFKNKMDREKGDGTNDTGWENPEFIKLLDLSAITTNADERKALLQEAEKILVDSMPIAPIYHYSFDYVKQKYLQDVTLSPLGLANFKKARLGTHIVD